MDWFSKYWINQLEPWQILCGWNDKIVPYTLELTPFHGVNYELVKILDGPTIPVIGLDDALGVDITPEISLFPVLVIPCNWDTVKAKSQTKMASWRFYSFIMFVSGSTSIDVDIWLQVGALAWHTGALLVEGASKQKILR